MSVKFQCMSCPWTGDDPQELDTGEEDDSVYLVCPDCGDEVVDFEDVPQSSP